MKVFKRSGSSYYAYKFQYRGKEYYRSTRTENRREAEAIAGAARTRIVRQAAGLEETEAQRKSSASDEKPKGIPTLRKFQTTFDEWVATAKAEQNGTVFIRRAIGNCSVTVLGLIYPSTRSTKLTSKRSKLGL